MSISPWSGFCEFRVGRYLLRAMVWVEFVAFLLRKAG